MEEKYFDLLNQDAENKWIREGEEKCFFRINPKTEIKEEVMFFELKEGDVFEAYESSTGKIIEHVDGKTQYTATSNAYLWNGIRVIEID